MTQSPDPSALGPQSSADPLTPFFFRGFFRLLYWSFFKPSAYRDYVAGILGDDADKEGWANFRAALRRPPILRLLLECLFLIIVVSVVVDIAIGLLSPESFSLSRVAFGVAVGVAFGVAVGVAFGVTFGVAFGVAGGVAVGVALGVAGGVAVGVAYGVALSETVNVASIAAGVPFGMAISVMLNVLLGVPMSMAVGVAFGVAAIVATVASLPVIMTRVAAFFVGFIRLPIYLVQFIVLSALRTSDAGNALRRSRAVWDELLVLPQPRLATILCAVFDHDPAQGLRACGQITCNPFQRWAVQRALRAWLDKHPDQNYSTFAMFLREPMPYRTPCFGIREERRRMQQVDFTAQLIIGELAGRSPITGVTDRLIRSLILTKHSFF